MVLLISPLLSRGLSHRNLKIYDHLQWLLLSNPFEMSWQAINIHLQVLPFAKLQQWTIYHNFFMIGLCLCWLTHKAFNASENNSNFIDVRRSNGAKDQWGSNGNLKIWSSFLGDGLGIDPWHFNMFMFTIKNSV